ncbi:MAG: hypothetical protein OXD46_16655 [Chloroflexi bacterium]|nr:hypothetical protein [Chloroflexota bacterium]
MGIQDQEAMLARRENRVRWESKVGKDCKVLLARQAPRVIVAIRVQQGLPARQESAARQARPVRKARRVSRVE